jgi:site-specific DNA-cytosine methylase
MDLGVSSAGFRILASIDLDPHFCSTLRRNAPFFGEPLVLEEDVRSVDQPLPPSRGAIGFAGVVLVLVGRVFAAGTSARAPAGFASST